MEKNTTIEFCTNHEYIREYILSRDLEDAFAHEAAAEWCDEFIRRAEAAGFETEQARGQRAMFHGWNGANTFAHKGAGWGTFDALTPGQIESLDRFSAEAAEAVNANPNWA